VETALHFLNQFPTKLSKLFVEHIRKLQIKGEKEIQRFLHPSLNSLNQTPSSLWPAVLIK